LLLPPRRASNATRRLLLYGVLVDVMKNECRRLAKGMTECSTKSLKNESAWISLAVRICTIFCMRFSAAIVRVILLRGILGSKRVK